MKLPNLLNVIKKILGGRPMTRITHEFRDYVSGQDVYRWKDTLGRFWLAEGRWSLFRVPYSDLWR